MRFIEMYVPARCRAVVDAFERAVRDACAGVGLARATVAVRSDGAEDVVVFALADPLGGREATVECRTSEPPTRVGRRAWWAARRLVHGTTTPREGRPQGAGPVSKSNPVRGQPARHAGP